MTSEGIDKKLEKRKERGGEKEGEETNQKKRKTMVALFVSLKVLYGRANPIMNVHVGSNKSGDWYYMVQNSLGTAAWGIPCALITPGSHNPG